MLRKLQHKLPYSDYTTKISIAFLYALLASIALNVFWRPGNIYASGITGLSQIITTFMERTVGFDVSVALVYFCLNLPLFFLAWFKISKKFTIFTFLTVSLTSLAIEWMPVTPLTPDPIICAVFGGAINGAAIGFAMKNGISSGGIDIITITLRQLTGKSVGSFAIIINGLIVITAGYLFGWQFAMYSVLSIFISGKVTDIVYTKQQKMQVMIITTRPEEVVEAVQCRLRRGITLINDAEGAFDHSEKTVLLTVITRYEMYELEEAMTVADPKAFVSISENVKILGNFYDPGM